MSPHLALATVFLVLLASTPASLGGSLDLVELNTVQYNVEILDTPVADLATAEEDKEVRIISQFHPFITIVTFFHTLPSMKITIVMTLIHE